tara:strand:+ start:1842 stop:2210 length:369 start_codon:yes stop_codon:yes gene_type:complete
MGDRVMKKELIVSGVMLSVLWVQPSAEGCENQQKTGEAAAAVAAAEISEQPKNKEGVGRSDLREKRRGEGQERQARERDRMNPEMRAKIVEKFDADGDGRLNETERAAVREMMAERRLNRNQ